jgi:phosphate-selective porin OprO/OprP
MSKKNALKNAALLALAAAGGLSAGVSAANAQTAAPAPAPTVTTRWAGSPETREEDRRFRVNGRIQYDLYNIQGDFPGTSNDASYTRTAVRRAFLGVEGRFTENWRYNVKAVFVPGASAASTTNICQNTTTGVIRSSSSSCDSATETQITVATGGGADDVSLDDAYLEYAGDAFSIFIGQNNSISPMEDRASSLNIPFNERAGFINAFGFGKIVGVDFLTNGGNWSWGIGLHGDDAGNSEPGSVTRANEAAFAITRGTWAPIYSRSPEGVTLLHLGASARLRENGGDSSINYQARPTVGFGNRYVSTGGFAESDTFYGGEFAFQHNAFGIDGEYGVLDARPSSGSEEVQFSGGYFDIFWSPTGESRAYNASDGSFGRITPLRTLGSDGGFGHVMLSARYDFLDLTDGSIDGGEQTAISGGVSWMPISYVKFQLNYTTNDIERPSSDESGNVDTITLRTQIDW